MEPLRKMKGNKGVRGGQGYEGVRHDVKAVFSDWNFTPQLHLQFDPCKIRAGAFAFNPNLLIQDDFCPQKLSTPPFALAAAAGLRRCGGF
jgi:hypothetical protein